MKKIKGNSWQFGNFGLPTSAVPVPYQYKPMGFEAFKEPLGELQASLDLV